MSELNNNKTRINWIDWAKSYCMLLVIIGHCHIQESESYISQIIYSFHMPFFFFISGILCNRKLSQESIKKDLKYILIPYFSFGIMTFLWSFARTQSFNIDTFTSQLQSIIFGMNVIGPFWFLPALFICKQLFLVIKIIRHKYIFLYYSICILSILPVYFISKNHWNIPFFSDSALCGLPFFIFGNEISSYIFSITNYRKIPRLLCAIILLCISISFSIKNGNTDISECIIEGSVTAYYIASLSAISSIILFCSLANQIRNTFIIITSYGSIVSLGLHRFILFILENSISKLLVGQSYNYPFFIALLYSSITYFICFILIVILDKHCPTPFGLRGQIIQLLKK